MISKEDKINMFINFVNATRGNNTVNNIYEILIKYDASDNIDREFAIDCLIQYFTDREEYEKCAILHKMKHSAPKRRRFLAREITPEMLTDLLFLGYDISDNLIDKILNK